MEDLIRDLKRKSHLNQPTFQSFDPDWHEGNVVHEYPDLGDGLEFAFFLRKKRLEPSDDRAFSIFDGGETVYVKIVDDESTENVQNYTPREGEWQVKRRGTKPKVEDVIATHGVAEAYRLGLLK